MAFLWPSRCSINLATMLSRWIHSTLVSLLGHLGLHSKTRTDFTAHREQWSHSRAVLPLEPQQGSPPSGATAGQSSSNLQDQEGEIAHSNLHQGRQNVKEETALRLGAHKPLRVLHMPAQATCLDGRKAK